MKRTQNRNQKRSQTRSQNRQQAIAFDTLESRTMLSAEVIGYLPYWSASAQTLENIDWESLTQVNYFATMPKHTGELIMPINATAYANPANRIAFNPAQMVDVNDYADTHDVKISIVVGGAGYDHTFSPMMASASARSTFITEITELCREYTLDGIDLDFEVLNPTATDIANYGTLIRELDQAAPELILSTAVNPKKLWLAPNHNTQQYMLNAEAVEHLDLIGIMAYDYTPGDTSHSPWNDTTADMQLWETYVENIEAGSKEKLLYGLPFYGRAGSVWGPDGHPDQTRDKGYADLLNEQFAENPGWTFDPDLDSFNLTFNGMFQNQQKTWNFDGANLIDGKTWYSIDQHYGGVMIWDLGHDHYVNGAPSQYALMPRVEQAVMDSFVTIDEAGHVEAGALSRNDTFTLSVSGSNLVITLGSDVRSFPLASVTSVTIDPKGGDDTVNINANINKPVEIVADAGHDTINVNAGTVSFNNDAPFYKAWSRMNVNVAPGASVVFNSTSHVGALTLNGNATATMTANGNRNLYVTNLSIAANAKLDLNDNDMLWNYDSASTPAQIELTQNWINSARAGGAWTGNGITSTSAKNANPKITTLGVMSTIDYRSAYGEEATFNDEYLDTTGVLVKYTFYGDTDFNGRVDGADYARIDASFNQQSRPGSRPGNRPNNRPGNIGGWFNGDFDGNGKIDGADYSLIDAAFNAQDFNSYSK